MPKMTLERLAIMMQAEFRALHKKIDEALIRWEQHDRRIDMHDNEISALETRVVKIEKRI